MEQVPAAKANVLWIGYWFALVSFFAGAAYGVVQIAQVAGLIGPPLDAILIYATSLAIATPFMLAILALHYTVPEERKFWTHAALLFAMMYNVFVTIMYVVQLGSVLPYNVTNPVLIVEPHSLFWTLDALGYISMGVATLFASLAFSRDAAERRVKYFFLANALVTPLVGLVYFYPLFSIPLLFCASPWIITMPGAMLTLAYYYKHLRQDARRALPTELRFSASLKIS